MTAATQLLRALSLRPASKGSTVVLARRRRGIAHVVVGPLTPSGRWSSATRARAVCSTRPRRLTVLPPVDAMTGDVGVCRRCSARLASPRGTGPSTANLVTRDQRLAAWKGTSLRELAVGVALCSTVEDTHSIGTVLMMLFGPAPVRRPPAVGVAQVVFDLHAALIDLRKRLAFAEMSDEDRAELAAQREDQAHRDQVALANRRKAARLDKLHARANNGLYLTKAEQEELGATG